MLAAIMLILGLFLLYLFIAALMVLPEASKPVPVTCPENGERVQVSRDPASALITFFTDRRPRVVGCSRWPERAGCDRACELDLMPVPRVPPSTHGKQP